jgi:hypothetical protein
MSSGLNVQNAVVESQLKAMTESRCKAWQGNALNLPVSYEQQQYTSVESNGTYGSTWDTTAPGLAAAQAADAGVPYATPFDFIQAESPGLGGFQAQMAAAVAALPTPVWGSLPAVTSPAFTGWGCVVGAGTCGCSLFQALAKNTTSIPLPYFVYRWQFGNEDFYDDDTGTSGVVTGVTYTTSLISIVQIGMILPGQVIGPGQTINIPFPGTCPLPLQNLGNTSFNGDQYTAVIGQDPAAYFLATGLVLGTSISTT